MNSYRWVASTGILLALTTAAVHYAVAPPIAGPVSVVGTISTLGPVWPILFGGAAVLLVAALVTGKCRYNAHVLAAACLSGYAVALWGTAILSGSTRGVVTAGLATALCMHALLLATVYSPRGAAAWTQR